MCVSARASGSAPRGMTQTCQVSSRTPLDGRLRTRRILVGCSELPYRTVPGKRYIGRRPPLHADTMSCARLMDTSTPRWSVPERAHLISLFGHSRHRSERTMVPAAHADFAPVRLTPMRRPWPRTPFSRTGGHFLALRVRAASFSRRYLTQYERVHNDAVDAEL